MKVKVYVIKQTSVLVCLKYQNSHNLIGINSVPAFQKPKQFSTHLFTQQLRSRIATPIVSSKCYWNIKNMSFTTYNNKSSSDDNNNENASRSGRTIITKRPTLYQAIKKSIKKYLLAGLIFILILILVKIVVATSGLREREVVTEELRKYLDALRTDEVQHFHSDDNHLSMFDIDGDYIANNWKLPVKSIFRFDGSRFEISKIEIFKKGNLTAAEWNKVESDPENEDLHEQFVLVWQEKNFPKDALLSPTTYRIFKLMQNNKTLVGISAGIKDLGRDGVCVAVQIFDSSASALFTLYYRFSTKDQQPIKRERREEKLDKITKLFSDIADEVNRVEPTSAPLPPTTLIKAATLTENPWNPYKK